MKTTTLAIVMVVAGFINVQAKSTPTPEKPAWFLKIFDQNGNGVLDPEERPAAKAATGKGARISSAIPILAGKDPARVTNLFNHLDKDASGSISLDEFQFRRHVK